MLVVVFVGLALAVTATVALFVIMFISVIIEGPDQTMPYQGSAAPERPAEDNTNEPVTPTAERSSRDPFADRNGLQSAGGGVP